jgi:hypothetical protein
LEEEVDQVRGESGPLTESLMLEDIEDLGY